MATLPPGVSAKAFQAALSEFSAALGSEWVFSKEEDLYPYRDPYSPVWGEGEERTPSGAVAPADVEQVQQIVRIANKYKIPLHPISTGRNLSYGGAAPNLTGALVLDLKRMNRVLRVDDQRHFALVEPGVTYFDLYRYVQDHGLKLMLDIPDPGWGSPVGNALDHGVGYTMYPYRDHFGAHCGMEVVLPNGELMRTGMGALPGADTWQDYKYGPGPYVDGLFGQGNYGIVTKMGFWFPPQPETILVGRISVPRHADIIPLVREINYLEDSGLFGMPRYGSPVRDISISPAGVADPDLVELMKDGWPSVERIEAYVAKKGVPAYTVDLRFYGPEEVVQASWRYAQKRISGAIAGAKATGGDVYAFPLKPDQLDKVSRTYVGVPSLAIFALVSRNENQTKPPDGHANCLAVFPRTGEAVMEFSKAVIEAMRSVGDMRPWTPFTAPVIWHTRTFMSGPSIMTYRDDPKANKAGRDLYHALIDAYAKRGWADYRANPVFQDRVVAQFSFNDHALLRFQEQLKDAVDPNGIIAPGRYGIWPKALRKARA